MVGERHECCMSGERRATMTERSKVFEECGCCGGYHRDDWYGDCRNDRERYTLVEAEALADRIYNLQELMEMEEEGK